MAWTVVGLVFLVISAVLFFVQKSERHKAFSIRSAQTVTTSELAHLAREIAKEIGGGSWQDYVKVSGMVECDRPIVSELRQEPCVYYTMTVLLSRLISITQQIAW